MDIPEIPDGQHNSVTHAVGAFVALAAGHVSIAEHLLGSLTPEQLVRIAAQADALSQACLAIAHPHIPDGVPPDLLRSAQRVHEDVMPQAYDVSRGIWQYDVIPPSIPGQIAFNLDFEEEAETDGES